MKISLTPPLFSGLNRIGAVAIPVLLSEELEILNAEAATLVMERRECLTETGVTQDFSGCTEFADDSRFVELARETEDALTTALGRYHALCTPIEFDDLSLQRYPVSKPGQEYAISPHKDYKTSINVVAVYLLGGVGGFFVCEDRSGTHVTEIQAVPGDLILMRATGFMRSSYRPFHYVGPVTTERLSFGLRQTVPKEKLYKFFDP